MAANSAAALMNGAQEFMEMITETQRQRQPQSRGRQRGKKQ